MVKKKKKYPIVSKNGILGSKEDWVNLIYGPKIRLASLFLLVVVIIMTIGYTIHSSLSFLINEIFDIFHRNLGVSITFKFISVIAISLIIGAIVFGILGYLLLSSGKKPNNWFFIALFLMVFFVIFGFFAIDAWLTSPLELNLFDENNIHSGTIQCRSREGTLIIGELIDCETELKEKNFLKSEEVINVLLIIEGREKIPKNLSYGPFVALDNVTYVSFEVYETMSDGSRKKLTVGYPFSFITQEEFDQNKKEFLKYFIALIAIIFVTIPSTVINIRNLWRGNKNHL